jgi:hypothetical protein
MLGVVKLVPVPMEDPPVATLYHVSVPPAHPDALNTTVPVPQRDPSIPVGAAGIGFTVAVTCVLGPSQPAALVHETQ